jgi:DNA-binding transcriptional MerR regulator
MLPDLAYLDLRELAAQCGVSIRTVRFYQAQGLIASPGQRGPGARYGSRDLDRLRFIRLLQRDHLPLAEIRKRLDVMSDREVAEALRVGGSAIERGSAAEYARRVLEDTELHRGRPTRRSQNAAEPMPTVRETESRYERPPEPRSRDSAVPDRRAPRESWERMEIAPDIELHIRRPLSREQNRLVERLLAAVQRFHEHED